MTREEAEARCAELNGEVERDRQWFARQVEDEEWEIVSVALPDGTSRPLKGTIEAKPKPPQSPDPRPSLFRNIPPFGPG
jgi:elongation factor P hydroxylase